jgi:hypothetical protein
VLAAYLGLRGLQACWVLGSRGRRWCLLYAVLFGLCVLATGINPYRWELHRWLAYDLSIPRPEIVEWRPPELASILWWQWWLLAAIALFAVVASRQKRDFVELVILGLTLWQSLAHQRHIPFFSILFAFWLPQHVDSALRRVGIGNDKEKSLRSEWSRWQRALAGGVMALGAMLLTSELFRQVREIPVRRDSYPVSAFQFMADQQLTGRMVTRFKWSQYLIAALGSLQPDEGIRVAFDGRFRTCYPQEMADMYFDFAIGGDEPHMRRRSAGLPLDETRILEFAAPDLVLIDRGQHLPVRLMAERTDQWTLLYQDQSAQLWGRRDKFDSPDSPHYVPPASRSISSAVQEGAVPWPALPMRSVPVARSSRAPQPVEKSDS